MAANKKSKEERDAEIVAMVDKISKDAVHNLLYHDRGESTITSDKLLELLEDKSLVSTLTIVRSFTNELRKEVE